MKEKKNIKIYNAVIYKDLFYRYRLDCNNKFINAYNEQR